MAEPVVPRRSALYLPASNPRAIAKARTLPCDVVILDLEDAVAPDAKDEARAQALSAIADGGFGARELVVRINAHDTPWGEADVAALAGSGIGTVLVPKVSGAGDLAPYRERLGERVALWAMVETVAAVFRLDAIAAAPGLAALVMGTNDLAREMGARLMPGRAPFLGFLAATVAAARLHGLAVLDGVCNAIDDPELLAAECAQGAEFGFDGKTLIHPSQIAAAHAAFTPDADAVRWAEAIASAFAAPDAAGKGALRVDGRMVERLHLDQARRVLALAAATS